MQHGHPHIHITGVFEDELTAEHPLSWLSPIQGFRAQPGDTMFTGSAGSLQLWVGLGDALLLNPAKLQHAMMAAGRLLVRENSTSVDPVIDQYEVSVDWQSMQRAGSLSREQLIDHGSIGLTLGSYLFSMQDEVNSTSFDLSNVETSGTGSMRGHTVNVARDLINLPASALTPERFTERALALLEPLGVRVRVRERAELESEGFGAIVGVGKGSPHSPQLLELTYGDGPVDVAFVGKGITFDSGGLSLKPSEALVSMKNDMAGAAAILGLFAILAHQKAKGTYVGILALAENMPGPDAVRPGDVVRSRSGKLIEILDTDFEGRVVLADAVARANEFSPTTIVDIATLTYAAIHALGDDYAALVSDDDQLAAELSKAGERVGERLWRMPLQEQLSGQLHSTIADLKNHPMRPTARTSTAALFVRQFVKPGIHWAHIDMLGPGWRNEGTGTHAAGGTGFGVQLLAEFVRHRELLGSE